LELLRTYCFAVDSLLVKMPSFFPCLLFPPHGPILGVVRSLFPRRETLGEQKMSIPFQDIRFFLLSTPDVFLLSSTILDPFLFDDDILDKVGVSA